jgi:hypothetical protein
MMDIKQLRCKAKSRRTGERCRRLATPGFDVCYYHGAGGGAPKGNRNALKYGVYVDKLLDDGERTLFQELLQSMREDFQLNNSSDRMSAEVACLSFIKLVRAFKSDNDEAMYRVNLVLRSQLQDLKATKEKREGDAAGLQTTPAEWMARLLEEHKAIREREAAADKPAKASKKKKIKEQVQ